MADIRKAYDRLADAVDVISLAAARATIAVTVLLGTGFVLSLLLQVFFRYVLNAPLTWSEEVAVFCFIWSMLLAGSLGVREGFHVRLSFVQEKLPAFLATPLGMVLNILIFLFGIYLISGGIFIVELIWDNTTAAIRYPIRYLYMSAPVAGALIALHSLAHLLKFRQ